MWLLDEMGEWLWMKGYWRQKETNRSPSDDCIAHSVVIGTGKEIRTLCLCMYACSGALMGRLNWNFFRTRVN